MSRILVLAPSGFGKTTSIGSIPELGLIGLNPKETFLIQVKGKPLPFSNAGDYVMTTTEDVLAGRINGNRVIERNAEKVAALLLKLVGTPFINVVLDDTNYLMQDWYMANAFKTGWDAPKKIGYFMGRLFDSVEQYEDTKQNVIILAHGEYVAGKDGREYVKLKTTGKMVDEYITPEGLFDVTLLGKSRFDMTTKKVVKEYITNEDENYSSAKSPYGMFKNLYIPNDLGLVVKTIHEFQNK